MAAAALLLSLPPQSPSTHHHFFPPPPSRYGLRGPIAVLRRDGGSAFQLKEGQTRLFHKLPSGLSMETIFQKGDNGNQDGEEVKPPLVFLHGSFHAAWCWAEHWLPFFSASGYDCYAISLLGQGESDVPEGTTAGTLQVFQCVLGLLKLGSRTALYIQTTHTSDVADFIQKKVELPPVLVGHSFGGLIVQSYISNRDGLHPTLAGAVLVCSVPPSGNSGLVWRYLLTKPIAAIKVTLSLAAKAFANSLPLCKETFFSSSMEDHLVQRYQILMKESSRLPLFDLKKLNASLPVPSVPRNLVPLLILGASDDFIVDAEGISETAKFYDVPPVRVVGAAHDMMLDSSWQKGAGIILSWLKRLNEQPVL